MGPFDIFLLVAFIGITIGMICSLISMYRNALAAQKKGMAELERAAALPIPLDECRATLVKKRCFTKTVGSKSSLSCQREFLLVFEDEFEREISLSVEEEIYLALEEGERGTLALSDGAFYSFTLDR